MPGENRATTIEKTGKRFKVQLVVSGVLFWTGFLGLLLPEYWSLFGIQMLVGLIWHLITKLRIWWHHH